MRMATSETSARHKSLTSQNSSSDENLLLDYARNENRDSFDQLVRRFNREIFAYLRRYLGSEHLAEDALQGTFLLLHRKCGQFDFRRRLRPWLYRIATNQANDLLRRNRRHQAVSLEAVLQTNTEGRHEPLLRETLADRRPGSAETVETAEPAPKSCRGRSRVARLAAATDPVGCFRRFQVSRSGRYAWHPPRHAEKSVIASHPASGDCASATGRRRRIEAAGVLILG